MRPRSVADLVATGRLEGQIRTGGTRRFCVLPAAALAATPWPVEPASDLAARLGTTPAQLFRMRARGILSPAPRLPGEPRGASFGAGRVAELERRLQVRMRTSGEAAVGAVPIAELVARRSVSLTDVVEGVLAGDLAAWEKRGASDKPLLHRMLVVPGSAADHRAARARGAIVECMSVREAAAALSLSTRMIPVLVASGCLTAADPVVVELEKRSVTRASVQHFWLDWMMSTEVAAALGTSTTRVVRLMATSGIPAAVESDSARGISAVWRRRDVEKVFGIGARGSA